MTNKLLLVDDELNILNALKRTFEDENYEIFTATSAKEGLNLLDKYSIHVIISDQRMPGMNGSEFLKIVKESHPSTVRIILSAYSDFDAIKQSINEGDIYKFLSKPWDDEFLRIQIREAFLINAQQKEKELTLLKLINYAKLSGFKYDKQNASLISEEELMDALHTNQFTLYYQPIIRTQSKAIKGCEALLRWEHLTHGLLNPDQFIGIYDGTEVMIQISEWVLSNAIKQMKDWHLKGYSNCSVSINIPVYLFNNSGFIELVQNNLQKNEFAPESLVIEITEGVAMQQIQTNIIILQQLKEMGVKIALDDFGTGFSSLGYLKYLPLDILKIDKSFIKDVTSEKISKDIIKAIVALAKSLRLEVVAEGVETEQEFDILKDFDCDYIQGYLFGQPMSKEDFFTFLSLQKR